DLLAQQGLGNAKLFGRLAEMKVFGERQKPDEISEIHGIEVHRVPADINRNTVSIYSFNMIEQLKGVAHPAFVASSGGRRFPAEGAEALSASGGMQGRSGLGRSAVTESFLDALGA
ncbi:MAG TPA: hypothetical protein PLV61_15045, partial [Parvularculaceae bacterium]|nr:hypothetical protein [Parvularculaceae bacterium]